MSNLRFIYVWIDGYAHSLFFPDETTHLCFKKLKYMRWNHFPFKSLDNFDMCNVVVLTLTESRLETLWEGIKSLKKLRILDVSNSYSLTKTGNLSGLENLEELYFHDCGSLKELHSSIGDLEKLAILDLRSIRPLKRIPWEIMGKLTSLQKLVLGNVYGPRPKLDFEEVHEPLLYSLHKCPITELSLYGCNLSGGVVSLPWLKHFTLFNSNYSSHPDSLLQLHELDTIEFGYCSLIQSIPNLPETVTSIEVFGCGSLVNLPCNISELKSLTVLHFRDCPKLGSKDPHFLMKVTGLTNLSVLKMEKCSVSHVSSEIGNLVSLKELDLSSNPLISSLPDTLSNLSQLLYLNISNCHQLRLLPLLPSNLTNIDARGCPSIRAKVWKDSPFSNRFMIILSREKRVPRWCSYQSRGRVLSFVAPLQLANIRGIILCVNIYLHYFDDDVSIVSKMHNKTKNTSHCFKAYTSHPSTPDSLNNCMCAMFSPLDDTTLMVEPGDSMAVVLKLPQGSVLSCGLRLISESDVVDSKLVIQTVTEPCPLRDSRQVLADQLKAIFNNSHGGDYFCIDNEDYSCSDDEDELWYKHI